MSAALHLDDAPRPTPPGQTAPGPVGFAAAPGALTPLRRAIQDRHRAPEPGLVAALAGEVRLTEAESGAARATALRLARAVRTARRGASGVDALMHEFSLSSEEGIALMCLAEALLRVPDGDTRDRLIADKIGGGDWAAHLGHSPSLFVNAAAWGLLVTGKLVPTHSERALGGSLRGLLRRSGAPVIRHATDLAIRMLGRQFVTGETIAEALEEAGPRERRGYRFSYDMLGEAAMTAHDAERYLQAYAEAVVAIGRASAGRGVKAGPGISIKLSALHPRYTRAQRERVMGELLPRVASLALLARSYDIGLNIDAEEADRLELSLDVLEALARDPALKGWNGLGFVVQAYGRRARPVIDWLVDLGRRTGRRLMVRLVKGAYWDSEIKLSQQGGFEDFPVFTRKRHTDVSYLACARAMLAAPDAIFPQFATHNAFTIGAVAAMAGDGQGDGDYEFQCLHGMGEAIYDELVGPAHAGGRHPVRVYAPVGPHETLLAYLVRRLLENGANSSFVNQVVDETIPIETLIADPVAAVLREGAAPHGGLRPPPDLFPGRRNSRGLDLASEPALAGLGAALAREAGTHPLAAPSGASGARTAVRNPADRADVVGEVGEASAEDVAKALAVAVEAQADWGVRSADERAGLLEAWADGLEAASDELIGLLLREAGKTARNAAAEIREAVDFCRYYAAEARAGLGGTPAGPMACISPWNFPLAIFTGQVAAALAAGNVVLAKPAEQTPLTAAASVRIAHAAGIPAEALQLLPGPGETVGAGLVGDPRVAGVVFTGSGAVAKAIERMLAPRTDDPVLIAETGGLNAMIVDSSALPEQVVADAIESAFDSAGQRCSALRLLCLQEDVADGIERMLEGAMAELRLGSPQDLATDIGPVIDRDAQAMLEAHVAAMRTRGYRVVRRALDPALAAGTFVAPTLVFVPSVASLEREVFGPILHVLRYRAAELPALLEAINATGYGLTHGVHTRIDETVELITGRIAAGNVYVNRNIVGAVVGSQPFGGEGLSGTGPKAGGPFYLHRLRRGSVPANAPAVGTELDLPGPTGESDRLVLHPRGAVACLGASETALAAQAAAALATGNAPVLPDDAAGRRIAGGAGGWARVAADPASEAVAAVLSDARGPNLAALRVRVAAREGAIVPVIGPDPAGRYPAWRLLAERSISINTAAAGGNAALLALGENAVEA